MDKPWRIELLGWLRASQQDRVISRFRSQQTGALLAFLSHHSHRSHLREALIELLWPECDLEAGRNNFRVALSSLRRQLEPPDGSRGAGIAPGTLLLISRTHVQLNPAACTTDAADFEAALLAAGRTTGSQERIQQLSEAVELYRGELLPGYYQEWVFPERQRLAEAFQHALEQLVALLERVGDQHRALQYARRAVSADPLREEAHQQVMRLLAAAHQEEAALRQYQELERLLRRELDQAPSPQTRALALELEQHRADCGLKNDPRASAPNPQSAIQKPQLHGGTLTFLLIEVESSVALRDQDGAAFQAALDSHHRLLRQAFEPHGGCEVRDLGDGWLFAFSRAGDALRAAIAGQQVFQDCGLDEAPSDNPQSTIRNPQSTVRMALHTGDVGAEEGNHHGPVLECAERILLAAHAGQILCSEETAGLLRRDLEPEVLLVDLGVYRLRGAGVASAGLPERLFQVECPALGQHSFPPPRAAVASGGHMPLQLTRFFGREREIEQVRELLSANVVRLITLTGPAGSGKTRLALQAAQRLQEPLPRTTWFVPLVDLADPCLIAAKLLEVLRLPHSPQPEPVEQVISFLSRQPSLLILDNFEHLVSEGTLLLRMLLERIPSLTCLVTSRQRLGLPGEQELPVPPLPVPGVQAFRRSGIQADSSEHLNARTPERLNALLLCASVQLFTDRAQAVRPDFQVTPANMAAVSALCARLEGLPLALELAAARAQMLTPQQMLARLDQHEGGRWAMLTSRHRGMDPRRQSLRAMLDWSYQLLSPELQQFFAHLSVFRGGFTLEAAEAVGGDLASGSESAALRNASTLEALEQLRECSLVLAEERGEAMRYRLLETLREYGAEQLSLPQRDSLARRHAAFYCALAEEAEPEVLAAGQLVWLKRLEQEHDNLRSALGWTTEAGEVAIGLRLAGALWEFWASQGHVAEGREHVAKLLRLPGSEARTPARAKALACAGILADFQGDFAAARSLHEEGLAIWRELGDRVPPAGRVVGIAFSLTAMGFVAQHQGDYPAAQRLQEESLSIWRSLGNELGVAWSLNSLADVAAHEGDFVGASARLRESLALRRGQGDQWGAAFALSGLGTMALYQGDLQVARGFYEESLAVRRALGDRRGIATSLANHGYVALRQGDLEEARSFLNESLAIQQELGDQWGVADAHSGLGHVACRRSDWDVARALLEEGLALRRALGDREGSTTCLEGLAVVAGATGQPGRAARLFGAAATLREARSTPLPPPDRAYYERHVMAARAALGETAFAAAWNRGRSLAWEQAVAEALGEE